MHGLQDVHAGGSDSDCESWEDAAATASRAANGDVEIVVGTSDAGAALLQMQTGVCHPPLRAV